LFFCEFIKREVILLYYFKMFICWNNLESTSTVLYCLFLDSSYCSNYCSSIPSKINLMGVIIYTWQKRGVFCITFVVKNLESNNQYFLPQTMISRFNLLPRRHFIYRFLIKTLFDLSWQRSEHLQPYVYDKPYEIQEQRFVAQFV